MRSTPRKGRTDRIVLMGILIFLFLAARGSVKSISENSFVRNEHGTCKLPCQLAFTRGFRPIIFLYLFAEDRISLLLQLIKSGTLVKDTKVG